MIRRSVDRLSFATWSSSIGTVLAAATDSGLAAVLIGGSETELRDDLDRRFPHAAVTAAGVELRSAIGAILQAIEDPTLPVHVSLDLRGTPFQQRVWSALRDIPAGETRTYQQIAEAIGAPRASRAVAAACAANSVAVLVPCHRVVRSDGSLGGYRWGLERKRALLARERGCALAA